MQPPFTITPKTLSLVSQIERIIGKFESFDQPKPQPQLRKSSRVKTLQGSLAIEGNSLDLEQITAVLDGKRVIAPKNDILEVINANEVYEHLNDFIPNSKTHLLRSHGIMMREILPSPGKWRSTNVGILKGDSISHMAPQPDRVEFLMNDLFINPHPRRLRRRKANSYQSHPRRLRRRKANSYQLIKYANKEYKHNGEIFKRSQSRRSDRNTRTS